MRIDGRLTKKKRTGELKENRIFLEALTCRPLSHFCYPNGLYNSCQFSFLKELDIKSATTCNIGLNSRKAICYELKRIPCGEDDLK